MTTPLTVGCFRYETTRALFETPPVVDGAEAVMRTADTLPEVFRGLIDGAYDAGEFGLTFYLRTLDRGADLTAIPVFPNRVFRHSCVFVNVDSGIERPEDLVGRTIGEFGVYGQDSGVWAKGILADEYGFAPERNRWVIGGLDTPAAPFAFTSHPVPDDLAVTTAPADRSLGAMLEAGEIDALFSANVPECVLRGSPHVRRLFGDAAAVEALERDHHRRTGLFPIMHTVCAPRALLDARPGVARSLYDAFLAARYSAVAGYERARKLYEVAWSMPWLNALVERNREQLGPDFWPYGVEANRHVLDTYLRYHHEQGLSARRWTVEELFVPELLDT